MEFALPHGRLGESCANCTKYNQSACFGFTALTCTLKLHTTYSTSRLISYYSISVTNLDFFKFSCKTLHLPITCAKDRSYKPRLSWEHDLYFMLIKPKTNILNFTIKINMNSPISMVCSYSEKGSRGIRQWRVTPQSTDPANRFTSFLPSNSDHAMILHLIHSVVVLEQISVIPWNQ